MSSIEEDILNELKEHTKLLKSLDKRVELNQLKLEEEIKRHSKQDKESDDIMQGMFPGKTREEIAKAMFDLTKKGTESMVEALEHMKKDKDSFKPFVKPKIDWSKVEEQEKEEEETKAT